MAATVAPPVRGRGRILTSSLLALSMAASGALAFAILGGVGAGVLAALGVDGPTWRAAVPVIVAIALVAVAADVAVPQRRPWAVGRQVPQVWGRLFSPPVVAVVYGLRLGVGPLTIVPTWTWWAAAVAVLLTGPAVGAAAGAAFGLAKAVAVLVAGAPQCRPVLERAAERTAARWGT